MFTDYMTFSDDNYRIEGEISLSCDSNWATVSDNGLGLSPQTHFVQQRINKTYFAENKGYKISGNKHI